MKAARVVVLLLAIGGVAVADRHHKPSAPVAMRLESVAVQGGFAVTLVAVPTRDVPVLELALGGQRQQFGATAAGQRRELTVRVPVNTGDGADVLGQVRVNGRGKVAALRVGAARPAAKPRPSTQRTLPDGTVIREVR